MLSLRSITYSSRILFYPLFNYAFKQPKMAIPVFDCESENEIENEEKPLPDKITLRNQEDFIIKHIEDTFEIDETPGYMEFYYAIEILIKRREIHQAVYFISEMNSFGRIPNFHSFNHILIEIFNAKFYSQALQFFSYMAYFDDVDIADFSYNIAARSYSNTLRFNKAIEFIKYMNENNIFVHIDTYNVVLEGLFNYDKIDNGFRLIHCMKENNVQLTTRSYNCIINYYLRHKQNDKAIYFLKKMDRYQLKGNEQTFKIILEYVYQLCDAIQYLDPNNKKPDSITFPMIIDFLCQNSLFNKVNDLLDYMAIKNIPLTIKTMNIIIGNMCYMNQHVKALLVFKTMDPIHNIKPNTSSYRILIESLNKSSQHVLVFKLFNDMIKEDKEIDIRIYNTILTSYFKTNQITKALSFYNSIILYKLSPNIITYRIIIENLCKSNKIDKAFNIINHMFTNNIIPSSDLTSILVKHCCMLQKYDYINDILDKMKHLNISPSKSLLNYLKVRNISFN